MYLKSLTLRGFKSFASATTLAFEPGITCVVGPNGSGKSNVVDALAWVMGEQGAKNLRGGKMDDVIFAGTSSRQALGRAEVSLTIDNTDGAIPIEYTEVTISRTLFRTGGSEYAVNGAPARLLDIQELLNDSGLGKEMHVIVGQGRLDQILHADPLERRGFIEEAAGVLKHRRRKDKALRKLTGLQANLDRVADLRAELARQLGPLGRQAKAAKRAAVVQAILRDTAARLLADDIVQVQARLATITGPEDSQQRREQLQAALTDIDERIRAVETQLRDHDSGAEAIRTRLRTAGNRATRATALAQRAGDRIGFLEQAPVERSGGDSPDAIRARAAKFEEELETVSADHEQKAVELAELTTRRDEAAGKLEEAEQQLTVQRQRIAQRLRERSSVESARDVARKTLADAQRQLAGLDEQESSLTSRLDEAKKALAAAQQQAKDTESGETALDEAHEAALEKLNALQETKSLDEAERDEIRTELGQAKARVEALQMSTRLAAETAELLDSGLPGIQSAVGDQLDIIPGCETAITAVLGELAGAVVVDDIDAALAVLTHVGEDTDVDLVVAGPPNAATGTTGAPATTASGAEAPDLSRGMAALDLVSTSHPGLAALLKASLGEVIVVDSADTAAARARDASGKTFVTPAGEVFSPFRVARASSGEGARIASRQALAETVEKVDALERSLAAVEKRLADAEPGISQAQTAVDEALEKLYASDAQIVAVGQEVSRAAEEVQRLEKTLTGTDETRSRLSDDIAQAEAELERAETALRANTGHVEDEPDTSERDRLAARVAGLGDEVMEARIAERGLSDRVGFLTDRIRGLERAAKQEEDARAQAARAAARRRAQAESARVIERLADALATRLKDIEARAEAELAESKTRHEQLDDELRRLRESRVSQSEELAAVTDAEHQAQLARERFVLALDELNRRAREDIGLSPENLVDQFGPHMPVPVLDETAGDDDGSAGEVPYVRADVEKAHAATEKELKKIGAVNPLALEEYAALKERHDYLEKQINDIETSRRDLLGLVDDVDEHVRAVFAEAFADTQREFADIFSRLFPGGEGRLELTEPDDMLATGVDVYARPAGKKVKRLSLLSGGERSLVAIAMLVAIFKARPSPFYVMDEVEAALDDLNLSRLLTVFQELQESSQLIVITHQKRTMEIADALYGVTMHGDGVSKVISQRIHRTESSGPSSE